MGLTPSLPVFKTAAERGERFARGLQEFLLDPHGPVLTPAPHEAWPARRTSVRAARCGLRRPG